MTTYVEFDEPWACVDDAVPAFTVHCTVRILAEDVIKWQRHREPRYKSDEEALDDFLVVHWARKVEV